MPHFNDIFLEPFRKINFKLQQDKSSRWYSHTTDYITKGLCANEFLLEELHKNKPLMLSRIGTSELHTVLIFLLRKQPYLKNLNQYIKGVQPEFWWGKYALTDLARNSGFFPSEQLALERFSKLYLEEMKSIDILLTWLKGESILDDFGYLQPTRKSVYIFSSEPYFYVQPWTTALKHKKILVIHPFEKSINHQYKKRKLLFTNGTLPEFELKTIKAIQSIEGNDTNFDSWFEALDHMKSQIDSIDFDIALIGAGSYGLPLASHIKRNDKIALHLGGFLQIIFGIRGKRWDLSEAHQKIMNEHWKYPFSEEYPNNYKNLDHGSYW